MPTQPTKADVMRENARLQKELELALRARSEPMPVAGGIHIESGWLVTTQEKEYAGTTLGVPFRFGMAFLPNTPENLAIVYKMEHDLVGYTVTFLEGEALQKLQSEGPEQALIVAESLMRSKVMED